METFISQFLFALSFQYIYIKTVADINPKIFPIVSILSCLFSIIFANINLTLADRVWTCICGEIINRDENAAINIMNVGLSMV